MVENLILNLHKYFQFIDGREDFTTLLLHQTVQRETQNQQIFHDVEHRDDGLKLKVKNLSFIERRRNFAIKFDFRAKLV